MLVLSLYVLFVPQPVGEPLFPASDKLVHLVLFALLAATTRWRFGAAPLGLIAVVGYAVASEVVQGALLSTRSGDPYDVLADLAGVVAGWLLARRLLT